MSLFTPTIVVLHMYSAVSYSSKYNRNIAVFLLYLQQ